MSRHVATFAASVLLVAAPVGCGDQNPQRPAAPSKPAGNDVAPVSPSLNGCRPETATDRTGIAEVEIRFGDLVGFLYEPGCIRISAGTRLQFVGDFQTHPLAVGRLGTEVTKADRASPLRAIETGEAATFVMDQPGSYPYFCNLHAWEGMMGAVFVD